MLQDSAEIDGAKNPTASSVRHPPISGGSNEQVGDEILGDP